MGILAGKNKGNDCKSLLYYLLKSHCARVTAHGPCHCLPLCTHQIVPRFTRPLIEFSCALNTANFTQDHRTARRTGRWAMDDGRCEMEDGRFGKTVSW